MKSGLAVALVELLPSEMLLKLCGSVQLRAEVVVVLTCAKLLDRDAVRVQVLEVLLPHKVIRLGLRSAASHGRGAKAHRWLGLRIARLSLHSNLFLPRLHIRSWRRVGVGGEVCLSEAFDAHLRVPLRVVCRTGTITCSCARNSSRFCVLVIPAILLVLRAVFDVHLNRSVARQIRCRGVGAQLLA